MIKEIFKRLIETFGPQNWWPIDTEYHKRNRTDWRFEVIVGAILTQNTRWKNVEKALENLKKNVKLDCKSILSIDENKLAELIKSVGFYRIKTKRIINFCKFLCERYSCDLNKLEKISKEKLRKELLSINGIGKETADAILLYAFGKPVFIVDSYTKRIFSRLGIIKENWDYEEIKSFFEKEIKKEFQREDVIWIFKEFHALIDELAKRICKKKPECEKCPLKEICRFYKEKERKE